MRIDELIGAKKFRSMSPVQAVDFVRKEFMAGGTKLRPLGRGTNGVALTDGEDVFKFWWRDSAYEDFIKLAMQNQDNPLYPKFKSKVKTLPSFLKIGGGGRAPADIKYVKMEKLQPYSTVNIPVLNDVHVPESRNKVDVMWLGDHATGNNPDSLIRDYLAYLDRAGMDGFYQKNFSKVSPEFRNLAKTLVDISKLTEKGHELDLGARNFALRGDQLVMLDPVSNDADIDINDMMLSLAELPPTE